MRIFTDIGLPDQLLKIVFYRDKCPLLNFNLGSLQTGLYKGCKKAMNSTIFFKKYDVALLSAFTFLVKIFIYNHFRIKMVYPSENPV